MTDTEGTGGRVTRLRALGRRRWASILFVSILALAIGSVVVVETLRPGSPSKIVVASPSEVILSASDIPEIGWGLRASGTDGTGVWRLFAVHNERILAFLNVTLWVEENPGGATETMAAIAGDDVGYAMGDGAVAAADASLFWSYDSGHYARMLVRRYNVVFLLAGMENSFALTKSDLGTWAGWQLSKIETLAS